MPYSQYTSLQGVRQKLGVSTHFDSLFQGVPHLAPSDWLKQTLSRNTSHRLAYFNEKSRSEGIVFPILSEMLHLHNFQVSLYSGANMEGDKELGLNGECDFILSASAQSIELECPIFCIIEAKDNDIDLGIPQCIAQLCGAKGYHQKAGFPIPPVLYGAVTTGTEWNFLKMVENEVTIDNDIYQLKNLPELLGVLNCVILPFIPKLD